MTNRAVAATVGLLLAASLLCVGGLIGLTGAASACPALAGPTATGAYDAEQLRNARIIITVGAHAGVPVRGQVIAIATALQESGLHNLGDLGPRNDHNSLGLFQQRPGPDWGTPAQIKDPAHAAAAFYRRLVAIPGWQRLPVTVAAQRIQRSALPDAYAKREQPAALLVQQLTRSATASATSSTAAPVDCPATAAGGAAWIRPASGRIGSGFRPPDRPQHEGVDIEVPRYTIIHAASAGTVVTATCNVSVATCDTDGGLAVKGCGWYVEIAHDNRVTTRYCHMVARPLVVVGQRVLAGTPIGRVGSSGNSTGPHLHFEVRIDGAAVNPVPYLEMRGVDLTNSGRSSSSGNGGSGE